MNRSEITIFCICISALCLSFSCIKKKGRSAVKERVTKEITESSSDLIELPKSEEDTLIIDSHYTFAEAIEGTKAPQHIIEALRLLNVQYVSTDGKLHEGQILVNKRIASDIQEIFERMLEIGFVVEKAIPIVKYNWNDDLSMYANNTHSFCYRKVEHSSNLSKHAYGMAIDINPRFNPIRWKKVNRPNQPAGAILDTTINGTFYPGHPIVEEFLSRGFRWGHHFSRYYDDHHFDK